MILEYLKRLVKKWFTYLIFVPDLTDLIQSHFNYTIPISSNILNYMALIALLYATYQVWDDTRIEKLELEEKLKSPIDYEVKAYIKKVKIELAYIESLLDKNIEKTVSLIHSSEQEFEKIVVNENDEITSLARHFALSGYSNKSEIFYKNDLGNYIKQLKEYADKKDTYLIDWKDFNDIVLKDIYFVDFSIRNIGRQFDEDIDIDIHFNNENKYIEKNYLIDNSPNSFNLPSKPERKKENEFNTIRRFIDNVDNSHELYKLQMMDSNPRIYRRYEEIKEYIFSIKLRDLKVSRSARIFRNNGYFIKIKDKNDIDVIISSKNSTSKINKKLIFEVGEEFDYFQDRNSI